MERRDPYTIRMVDPICPRSGRISFTFLVAFPSSFVLFSAMEDSHGGEFFFLGGDQFFDLLDAGVGHLLDVHFHVFLHVFGDESVLPQLLQLLYCIPSHVSDRHLAVFAELGHGFGEFFPPFGGERGDVQSDDLPVVVGRESHVGFHDGAFDVLQCAHVERLHEQGGRVRRGHARQRPQRRGRTVVVHLHAIQQGRGGTSGSHGGDGGSRGIHGLGHARRRLFFHFQRRHVPFFGAAARLGPRTCLVRPPHRSYGCARGANASLDGHGDASSSRCRRRKWLRCRTSCWVHPRCRDRSRRRIEGVGAGVVDETRWERDVDGTYVAMEAGRWKERDRKRRERSMPTRTGTCGIVLVGGFGVEGTLERDVGWVDRTRGPGQTRKEDPSMGGETDRTRRDGEKDGEKDG
eukprot:scaffold718_cov342-Pavlova_lutheri.AAC.49